MFDYRRPYEPHQLVVGSPLALSIPAPQLHAFARQGGEMRVFVFPDTQDGREELGNLLRGEAVLKVVQGHEAIVTSQHRDIVRTTGGVTVNLDETQMGLSHV